MGREQQLIWLTSLRVMAEVATRHGLHVRVCVSVRALPYVCEQTWEFLMSQFLHTVIPSYVHENECDFKQGGVKKTVVCMRPDTLCCDSCTWLTNYCVFLTGEEQVEYISVMRLLLLSSCHSPRDGHYLWLTRKKNSFQMGFCSFIVFDWMKTKTESEFFFFFFCNSQPEKYWVRQVEFFFFFSISLVCLHFLAGLVTLPFLVRGWK